MKKDRTLTPEEQRLWRQAMGERAGPASPKKNAPAPAPVKKKPAATPLAVKTGKEAKRAVKPRGEVEATLDLHGMSKLDAYERVAAFIARCQARGQRHLLIITGKGRGGDGVLRRELPHWLNEPQLRRMVGSVAQAGRDKGGEGVFHVLLKRS